MSKPLLSNEDFCRASKRLRCDVAAIKAVANTESAGKGFYDDGFPVILYERHLFRKFTNGKFNNYPELSGPQGNYGATGANQRRKFSAAFALDPDAAMKACSWGKFQILGSNHKVCGYNTVGEFVDAMKESEGKQLDAFVEFVIGNQLSQHLRDRNWAKFARGYNGPAYKKNNYDTKMATANARFGKENIDCSKVSAAAQTIIPDDAKPATASTTHSDLPEQPPTSNGIPLDTTKVVEETTEETPTGTKTTTAVSETAPDTVLVKAEKPSLKTQLIAAATAIYGIYLAIKANAEELLQKGIEGLNAKVVAYALLSGGVVALAIWLYDRSAQRSNDRTGQLIDAAADQGKNTVVLTK